MIIYKYGDSWIDFLKLLFGTVPHGSIKIIKNDSRDVTSNLVVLDLLTSYTFCSAMFFYFENSILRNEANAMRLWPIMKYEPIPEFVESHYLWKDLWFPEAQQLFEKI